ncbi:CpsD/CapB family tyrosine-protein kinase [Candidatus Desulforudis audaxviator]|uniref:CpsD/CapB family tyrosine-protein kinase n=1 Tax=Candidatus Desulforudis audaxviator TaxID=471827 RepID=UPI001079DB20|nr:CpsD/CapB family tyrosine-protein kinase [Candidatus Desulforudis audaxviator]AZK60202.1 polysaccharide biosynthesis tyrosine autokinase [Candidatus Desulforudis audaxviator]
MQMTGKNGAFVDLVAHKHPKSAAAEAYRTLRTNLGFAAPDRPARVILVSSAGPADGKTTTVSNLAVVLAQAGHSVCLVDSDLRKPRLHRLFGVENTAGLTNVLSQNAGLEEVVVNTEVDRLALLPSGPIPPNPAELLGSGRMQEVLDRLAERYDFVLADSPPVLAVTDASLLAGQVDGVLLVIRAADTRVDLAQEAKAQLAKAGGRVLGVVLNKVRLSAKDYGYYYYYHHRPVKEDQIRL